MQTSQQLLIDGTDVFIEGDGAETIVMIHGWPDTYRLWDGQVSEFKSRYRCVRFTLPGFDNTKLRRAYSLAETMELFKKIIEQTAAGQKVILLLHDWGCMFGYAFYMQYPTLVSKIIAVDIGDTDSHEFRASLSLKAKLMVFAYQNWLAFAWRLGGTLGDRMTRFMARVLRCRSDPQFIHSGMGYPYYIKWMRAYGSYAGIGRLSIECPLLFIYGSRKMFMFHSREWQNQICQKPGCRVVELNSDHWVMTSRPDEFNQAVSDWLGA